MQVIQWKRSRNTCWRQQLSNAGILFGFASTLCWCHWKILLHLLSSKNPSIQWFQTLHPSSNVAHATICQGKSRFPHCYRRKQLTKDLLRRKAVLIPLVGSWYTVLGPHESADLVHFCKLEFQWYKMIQDDTRTWNGDTCCQKKHCKIWIPSRLSWLPYVAISSRSSIPPGK